MHDWLIAIILGLVEGITEFIPVSSTGHLLIAEKFLGTHQTDLFNIVIQCGAVIAVLPLFPQRLYKFVFELNDKETQSYPVSYTHLRAHETDSYLVCRLLLEKKK